MSREKSTAAVFFDFDGVLVDSTSIKTAAYRELFKSHGPETVAKIVSYHQQNAGISRVVKIDFSHRHFLATPYSREDVADHVEQYSRLVLEKVVAARWVPGAREFVESHYRTLPLFIVSGTPQEELDEIIRRRGMERYFREVLGSPTKKPGHIRSLVKRYNLEIKNCFFVGDALTDYDAARETGMPFIGIRSETAFPGETMELPDCKGLARAMTQL